MSRPSESGLKNLEKRWIAARHSARRDPERALRTAVSLLDEAFPAPADGPSRKSGPSRSVGPNGSTTAAEGYPFDALLLKLSPLYRKSRECFLRTGGSFHPTVQSSPRSLGSASLLDPVIEYTPLEKELRWSAKDPLQKKEKGHLLQLKSFAGSLFHEQNHRTLWALLPPPPASKDPKLIRRHLNFAESLVIAADFALGDQLYPLSEMFWQFHACYDPGTKILRGTSLSRRDYRNYLQAAVSATFLTLELYDPRKIPRAVESLFPGQGELARHAAQRATQLDEKFVVTTNRIWQRRHARTAAAELRRRAASKSPLIISADPLDQTAQYLWAERWFDGLGL